MSARERYRPGVPCWIDTVRADPAAAVHFYRGLFGWRVEEVAGASPGRYLVFRLRGRAVAGIVSPPPGEAPPAAVWRTHVAVASVERAVAAARAAGGRVVRGPCGLAGTAWLATVADSEGARLGLWEAADSAGAELVNEPGAWSWSELRSADPQAARAFYGAVFGWSAERFDAAGGYTAWRLPGNVGGEPAQPLPRDAVAGLAAAGEGEEAGWAVELWVDDVEPAVERALALGGALLSAPSGGEVFGREATLADPEGARFTLVRARRAPVGAA